MASTLACLSLAVIFMISTSQCCTIVVETGYPATIRCHLVDSVTSITFQLLTESTERDISTCNFDNNNCTDSDALAGYNGYIVPPASNKTMVLNITSARISETEFKCLSDNKNWTGTCSLVVYGWPFNPSCSQRITSTYVEFNCTTRNVYPILRAVLHRQVLDFTPGEADPNNTNCVIAGTDVDGTYIAWCVWRFPIEKVMYGYSVYVEMSAVVTNVSLGRNPSFSINVKPYLVLPEVQVRGCPVDPRIVSIRIGAQANCTCQLTENGYPEGYAQWVDSNMKPVGIMTPDGSSILTLSYNSSGSRSTYQCLPVPPFIADVKGIPITVTSSARSSVITALQTVVILLGALGSVFVSRFP